MSRSFLFLSCLLICFGLAIRSFYLPDVPNISTGVVGEEVESSKFLFLGDIMLARYVETLIKEKGGDYPFQGLEPLNRRYDKIIGNFEAPIGIKHKQTLPDSLDFSVASSSVKHLHRYVDIVSLANNHTFDQQSAGLDHTRDVLNAMSVEVFGDPLVESLSTVSFLEHGEQRIALLGINATRAVDQVSLAKLLTDLQSTSSMQIAYVHWGIEYEEMHSKEQEKLAHWLIDYGVDTVIGHHPHVVQGVSIYKGAPIFYSLGNFVFDQYFDESVMVGLGVELALDAERVTYRLVPFTTKEHDSSPRLMPLSERVYFLNELADRSGPEIANNIAEHGILELSVVLASL